MSAMYEMLGHYKIPKVAKVEQIFDDTVLNDPEKELLERLLIKDIRVKEGDRIAITGGSRGIAEYKLIMRTVVKFIKSRGGIPFIVPAMGSHGGGTAEGQEQILKKLGITEDSIGAPIVSSMEVVEIGRTKIGNPVYVDRNAYEADGIILLNRVKTHTSIREVYQSGLVKMMAIGLAKHKGATLAHSMGTTHLGENVIYNGKLALDKLKVICGISVIENGYEQLADIYVSKKEEILETEPKILEKAKSLIPKIMLKEIDCLIIYEQGKDVSGTGMDPAIIGRPINKKPNDGPEVGAIGVLRLTKESYGNASGCGMADFITREMRDDINEEHTVVNSLTGMHPGIAKIPITLDTDKLVFQGCIKACGQIDNEDIKLVIIRSTKSLDEVYMSKAAIDSIKYKDKVRVLTDYEDIFFDKSHTLRLFDSIKLK